MLLKVKALRLFAGRPIAILHEETARYLNLHVGERIRIKRYGRKREIVAPVDLSGGKTLLNKDEIALSQEIFFRLHVKDNELVEINPALKPLSINYIYKKLNKKTLTFTEIYSIISDVVNNELTEAEVAFFVSSIYLNGMNNDEIVSMTRAMVKTGAKLKINNPIIIDKHSIGGVEGNRTTPIIISILSVAIDHLKLNAVIPKTSSRAITSAAGTADVMETLAKVDFSIGELKEIIRKTNACLVWGGSLGLAPADDKIIQVERVLYLDPQAQLIASILSKKLSVNATHVLIDISYGKGAKVKDKNEAKKLKTKFEKISKKLNLNVIVTLTNGAQPLGNGIGAALEMLDVINILKQDKNRPMDLEKRSLFLASELLSFVTNMPKKNSQSICKELLISGKAFKKFEQIIEAQQGSLANLKNKLKLGAFKHDVRATKSGIVIDIKNKDMAKIARIIGSPSDKGAGIFLHKHKGKKVKKNQPLFTIYSETKAKLNYAKTIAERRKPVVVE